MSRRSLAGLLLIGPLAACGGGGPMTPTPPSPPGPVYSVAAIVFYDENGNGRLDAQEHARIPNAAVVIGGQSATSATLSGTTMVNSVPGGAQQVTIRDESLPPFFVPPAALPVSVPLTATLELPVTLPIGSNSANVYMAYGDSITLGDGSSDRNGYILKLERQLRQYYGAGEIINEGFDGTGTEHGEPRIAGAFARRRPAWTLIHYGTNDYNKCDDVPSCFTADNLRSMVRQVKAAGGQAALATIIPANVGFDARSPPARNDFVAEQDKQIRVIAREEGAVLVDLEPAFYKAAGDTISSLFVDHVHPNDRGYDVMVAEFFKALTTRAPSTTSLFPTLDSLPSLGLQTPDESPWARPETISLRPR